MLRMFEGKISSQSCEAPEAQKIYRIIGDYSHSNIIYAVTDSNDLIVYEAK